MYGNETNRPAWQHSYILCNLSYLNIYSQSFAGTHLHCEPEKTHQNVS